MKVTDIIWTLVSLMTYIVQSSECNSHSEIIILVSPTTGGMGVIPRGKLGHICAKPTTTVNQMKAQVWKLALGKVTFQGNQLKDGTKELEELGMRIGSVSIVHVEPFPKGTPTKSVSIWVPNQYDIPADTSDGMLLAFAEGLGAITFHDIGVQDEPQRSI